MNAATWLDNVRSVVAGEGTGALVVRDLRQEDLADLGWAGGELHLRSVGEALARVPTGEVDYLVVVSEGGWPVAKGGVDYANPPGAARLWQLATHPRLQGLGIGTRLIAALEDRIKARGYDHAELGVETSNPRAHALYTRLGYVPFGSEQASWDQQDEHGQVYRYETECVLMRKRL